MARAFAKTIAGIIPLRKRLVSVCIPYSVGGAFVDEVVAETNARWQRAASGGTEPFAVRVVPDNFPNVQPPNVIASAAEEYRSDSRLFVWLAGEFQPLASMASTVPPKIADGFPAEAASSVSPLDLSEAFCEAYKEGLDEFLDPSGLRQFKEALQAAIEFLQQAFEFIGNDRVPWTSAWWTAMVVFLDTLAARVLNFGTASFDPVTEVYASAGLPIPSLGKSNYTLLKPETYSKIVEDRLANIDDGHESFAWVKAKHNFCSLSELPWDELAKVQQIHGHAGCALTTIGFEDPSRRHKAWAGINEGLFLELEDLVNTHGKLVISWKRKILPELTEDPATFLLPTQEAKWSFPSGREVQVCLEDICFLIPWHKNRESIGAVVENHPDIKFRPPSGWDFKAKVSTCTIQGLEVKGTLSYKAKSGLSWPEKPIKVQCANIGTLVGHLNQDAECRIIVPNPWGVSVIAVYGDRKKLFLASGGKFKVEKKQVTPNPDDLSELELKEEVSSTIFAYRGCSETLEHLNSAQFVVGRTTSVPYLFKEWKGIQTVHNIRLSDGLDIRLKVDAEPLVTVTVNKKVQHPWLPLAATTLNTTPCEDPLTREMCSQLRGYLEEEWLKELGGLSNPNPNMMVYCVLPTTDADTARGNRVKSGSYTYWLMEPPSDYQTEIENAGGGPPREIFDSLEFKGLLDSLDKIVKELDKQASGGQSSWPSRWQLKNLNKILIDRYLDAYLDYVKLGREISPEAMFWVCYPFSAIIYNVVKARVEGVLLSPLHPLRLGWLYGAERAVVEGGFASGQNRREITQLMEGWNFPWIGPAPTYEAESIPLVSTPIDAGPEQLFLGWSALARCDDGNQPQLPSNAAGWRVPGGSSSGLNRGGVGAAVGDFLRVYPHLPTLTVDLYAGVPGPRSTELDLAVIVEMARIAADEADAVPLPQALRILDSKNRLGFPPERDAAFAAFKKSFEGPMPAFEWRVYEASKPEENKGVNSDLRLVEDAQARVSRAFGLGQPLATFARWPVRRLLARELTPKEDMLLHGHIDPECCSWRNYADALAATERSGFVGLDALRVKPTDVLMGTTSRTRWVVTGNVLVDPKLLVKSIAKSKGGASILWEWRPPFLPRFQESKSQLDFGRRSYITIAKVPDSFKDRISHLHGLDTGRTETLLKTLGIRGIGLASLLSMGGNQAEGALGFYFAMQSLELARQKMDTAKIRYFVIPLDAVNNLLVGLASKEVEEANRRADLLVLRINEESDGKMDITFLPVEVRCSKYTSESAPEPFPGAASKSVIEKLDQLLQTRKTITNAINSITSLDGADRSIQTTAMASIIETAFLVSEAGIDPNFASQTMKTVVNQQAKYKLASGLLLWFQRTGTENVGHQWTPPQHQQPNSNGILFVDPSKVEEEMWGLPGKKLADWVVLGIKECIKSPVDFGSHSSNDIQKLGNELPEDSETLVGSEDGNNKTTDKSEVEIDTLGPELAADLNISANEEIELSIGAKNKEQSQDTVLGKDLRVFIGTSKQYPKGIWWEPWLKAKPLNNSHVVILGSAGSGKTQALTSILYELHKQGIPSLILDFKDDYVSAETRGAIGAELHDATEGLPVNPLALPVDTHTGNINVVNQIYQISGIFKAVYGLGDIQESHLREALYKTYEAVGIKRNTKKLLPGQVIPQFNSVKIELDRINDPSLSNRLAPIFDLNLFDEGAITIDSLLESSNVLRFTQLPSEEVKKAAGGIVLRAIYNALLKRGHRHGLKLAIVIDEAHRIANLEPVKLLIKEARAFGVGVFLSSQEARDFEPSVFANAGTLLTLKMAETTDADRIAKLLATGTGFRELSDELRGLDRFEGMIRNDHYKPYAKVKVSPFYERFNNGK